MRKFPWIVRGVVAALIVSLLAYGMVPGLSATPTQAASPHISVSKTVLSPGDSVTVRGGNFKAGDQVVVSLVSGGQSANSIRNLATTSTTAGGGGGFSVSLTVPQGIPAGWYGVVATDAHGNSAFNAVQVPLVLQTKAGQSLTAYAVPGLFVRVSGTGFTKGEQINLSATFPLYNGNAVRVPKTVTADANGAFSNATFQVPWDAKNGNVPLSISGASSGKSGAVTVTLKVYHKPFLLLASNKVPANSNLVGQAIGFVPGAHLTVSTTITRSNAGTARLSKTLVVGSRGRVQFSLNFPNDVRLATYAVEATGSIANFHAFGRYTVTAAGSPPKTPSASNTPTPKAKPTATPKKQVKASIIVAPKAVVPGADAQVIGKGFPANAQVTVTARVSRNGAAQATEQTTAKTNNKGIFVATLHTPGDAAAGGYSVQAASGATKAFGSLRIEYLKTSIVSVPARAIPGTPITVTGFGYASGSTVTVTLNGQTLGTATADATGSFKQQFTVPGSMPTGFRSLVGTDNSGRKATFSLQIYRHITTRFYFASLYTGPGYHEYLLFTNASAARAVVHITYQHQNGNPTYKTVTVPAHSRLTHDVNKDLGYNVLAAASLATNVPIAAERMVMRGSEGSLDPGAQAPSYHWYFSNGNTSHQYHELIAVQNPENSWAQVTLQVQPTHSQTYYLHGNLRPQSRMTWNLNKTSRDAIGVIVSANHPVVANRTIIIHNGISSKTGVTSPANQWYFAAGPNQNNTRNWIGVINATNQPNYMVLQAYDVEGAPVLTVKKWLRPYDRQGFLMNKLAGQVNLAVVVTTTKPSISEQSTFVTGNHWAHTDSFGVVKPGRQAEFAEATTWAHQDNLLALFNPNASAIPIVVQYLNQHGGTTQQTYIVAPFAHAYIDVAKVVGNSQLGLLAVCNYPFVALDRQLANDGKAAMTSLGTQS